MSSSSNFPAGRPKRAGDSFALSQGADGPSSKKPRFDPRNPSMLAADAEEEDPILEAGEIGKGAGVKRSAVNIDGYNSDSDENYFDTRAAEKSKSKATPTKDDDDDDMFAEVDKDKEQEERTRHGDRKKDVRFLEEHEIEGQDETSKPVTQVEVDFGHRARSRTNDVDSDTSSDADDEERARIDSDMDEELGAGHKKKNAPKVDAFNMKGELEEGRFDEFGTFVWKARDPDEDQDVWLEGVTKKDIKRAKAAKDKLEAEQRERERAEDSIVVSDVLSTIIKYVKPGETPLQALPRHNKAIPPTKTKSFNKYKKTQAADVEPDPAQQAKAAKAQKAIEAITECASQLQKRGVHNIYDIPRETIMLEYKRETGEDWKDPHPEQWEFRWLAAPEGDVHGPYDTETMRAWESRGEFEAGAEFRRVGEAGWSQLLDLE